METIREMKKYFLFKTEVDGFTVHVSEVEDIEIESAIEKQIPKKPHDKVIVQPVIDQDGAYIDADVHISFHCPVCGEYVGCELEESHYNYCFECGQRIDWDNENSGGDAE